MRHSSTYKILCLKQETLIRQFYLVNAIRKIQHIKPPAEKIFQYLYKIGKSVEKDLLFVNISLFI